ncbi:MAG: hypothetical protein E7773_09940 [Sphingomonas sp.]|uniref:hypothetical protein n=1 Tax=Sphingomonas sp. TaxID=28214 RepID=UPI001215DCA1|nr:hypothetical protein [Sphingomonas sp.]THD36226.1 MAG: hypothetical protein E7773_09940 [Sphingomonas sp.]
MPRKTSPARVEAFFRALAETGNQTIAAERAGVSTVWARRHRAADPVFAERLAATIAAASERLRAAASVGPDGKWRMADGEELVVRGRCARRVQIARARPGQFTPRTEARFLKALAQCCNVAAASRAVGLTATAAYYHYHRWPDFAKRWDAALEEGYVRLEMALFEAAGRVFRAVDYPQDVPIEPMSFDQAITLLHQHQLRVHGTGKPQGVRRAWKPKTGDEAFAELAHKLDRMEKMIRAREGGDPAAQPAAVQRSLARGMRVVRGDGGHG